jgi:hypothetical protein
VSRGRRRRGRRRGPRKEQREPRAEQKTQAAKSSGKRRRRRRKPRLTYESFLASAKMKEPQTLPPDELSADEIISDLKEQHGSPTTPQEFRLTLKVSEAPVSNGGSEQDGRAGPRRRGGRRRGRGGGPSDSSDKDEASESES